MIIGANQQGNDSHTILYIGGGGANGSQTFVDQSRGGNGGAGHTITANGNVQHSTAQTKYRSSSILFDGNGDYLSVADHADFDCGTGDFYIFAWLRLAAIQNSGTIIGARNNIFSKGDGWNNATEWSLSYGGDAASDSSNKLRFATGGAIVAASVADVLSINTWYYLGLLREGGTLKITLDGAVVGSAASSHNLSNSAAFVCGVNTALLGSDRDLNGYMDDIMVSRGIARRPFVPNRSM